MAVVLKSQQNNVVDALRAARNADDELTRLQENSWENQRKQLTKLVEASNWRYGPAQLIATFDHHLVAKAPNGSLVQVEWEQNEDGYHLGYAAVHKTATPVADLGHELMETARSAVDQILEEDFDGVQNKIATIAEALDAGGDLQRQVNTEITVRSLTRDAWWHQVVGVREGIESKIPAPQTEGENAIESSVADLLQFLRESATDASNTLRALADTEIADDIESLARDVAEDTERAVSALVGIDTDRQEEALKVYEAVMNTTPRLLNGIAFLKELTQSNRTQTDLSVEGQEQ